MFNIKVYNRQQTQLIDTIKPSELLSDFSFNKSLNSSVGEISITLAKPLSFNGYGLGNIVTIIEYNDNNKGGIQHYKGIISKINRVQTESQSTITLTILGVGALLSQYDYIYSFSGQKAGKAVKDLIDDFNSRYGGNTIGYTTNSIDNGPDLPSNGYIKENYLKDIAHIATLAGFVFYVDGYGIVHFKDKSNTKKHYLVNKKNVQKIVFTSDLEGVVNYCNVEGEYTVCGGGSPAVCRKEYVSGSYQDNVSIGLYGIQTVKTIRIYTNSEQFCIDYAKKYVEDRKQPRNQCQIVVNRDYNIESINPGDLVTVLNIDVEIKDLEVTKVSYNTNTATITLGEYRSFGQMVVGA